MAEISNKSPNVGVGSPEYQNHFHWKDNWFFSRRTSDGAVIIEHWENHADVDVKPADFRLEIPGTVWCSIVASCSAEGETSFTWRLMRALHGDWTK